MAAANNAAAPTSAPIRNGQMRERWRAAGVGRADLDRDCERVFTLDDAPRDIVGHGVDDRRHLVEFGEHDAAMPRVLHEAIGALVAPHHDVRDHIDPEPRRIAPADAAVEQIDVVGNLGKQRIERLGENLQPRDFGITQVDHHAGTVRCLDAGLTQGIAQPAPPRLAGVVLSPARPAVAHGFPWISLAIPAVNLAVTNAETRVPARRGARPKRERPRPLLRRAGPLRISCSAT